MGDIMKTKEDETYHYVIQECAETPVKPQWTLFSDDEYGEGDSILLRQDNAQVILSEDGEQAKGVSPNLHGEEIGWPDAQVFPKAEGGYGMIVEKKLVHEGRL
jgi:hypothetical protein